jgi:hypothetical protein
LLFILLPKKKQVKFKKQPIYFSCILVFIGAGTIDSSLKYLQTYHVPVNQIGLFSTVTFFCAFCVGVFPYFFNHSRKIKFSGRNILGGIMLWAYPITFLCII